MVFVMVPFRERDLILRRYAAEHVLKILRYDIGDDFSPVFDNEDKMVVQAENRMVVPVQLCHYVAFLSAHPGISIALI